ncbi:non-ribosomal peptide synthetase [Paenibacillus donghaensis]|uniref:Carrier domain-containing protein n=1 Tax=Paenibacillus donghaensis TaxID=414771 RepID=A0A2Z2KL08_9BACL|nr:non-ribosomal peptide synthetase [Paenibacillus donghaensis]ASA20601.1 hypothetical protein B9T62_07200 [Paenibacillus donghaensis]
MDKVTRNIVMSSEAYQTERHYWMNKLQGDLVMAGIPADSLCSSIESKGSSSFTREISGGDFERIMKIGNSSELGVYLILLTALKSLFVIYNNHEDVLVGMPVFKADPLESRMNRLLPLRSHLSRNFTLKELLNDVNHVVMEADEHKHFPMDGVAELLAIQTADGLFPEFRTVVLLDGFHDSINACNNSAELVVSFYIGDSSIAVKMEYRIPKLNESKVSAFAEHFFNLLHNWIESPETRLCEIEYLSLEEKNKLLFAWNDTDAEYCGDKTLHQLFEEQADRTPHHIAIQYQNKRVTYKQLDEQANVYANYLLQEHDLTPGTLVGVMLDKSDELIAVTLGILKAGGAYVPMDPEYPEERLKMIIEDAGMHLIISGKRYIKTLNKLQWECNNFKAFLCVDTHNVMQEEENEKNELMGEEVWKYVGLNAKDDIEGGAWTSSYTGGNLSKEDMEEYTNNIECKLKPYLNSTTRVLEIGCASGLSMYPLAPQVGWYYGTDLSEVIIGKNRERVQKEGIGNIKLACIPAHDIDKLEEADFDVVILNSVVQCFHGHNYFKNVISKCLGMLRNQGILFIGDVMDQERKADLLKSLVEFKQAHEDKNYRTKTDWSVELFLSPGFFEDLRADFTEITAIQISDKIHTITNELTAFRYDAIIHVDKSGTSQTLQPKLKLQHGLQELNRYRNDRFHSQVSPNSLAYIIYTSGTTGKPKGAMIEHRNVVRLMSNSRMPFEFNEEDVWTMFHSYSFDFSVWEMYGALLYGGKLIVIPKPIAQDTSGFLTLLKQNKVTVLNQTPSAFYRLIEQDLESGGSGLNLRYVIFGGEALRPGVLSDWQRKYSHTKLINMYGITETTVHATYKEIGLSEIQTNCSNIGKPIPTLKAYVMSDNMRLLPAGIVGELCIGGDGVCRGYLNRPAQTLDKFVDNPYQPGQRLYRSGDLAKLLPNGELEYCGRMDQQVKIRGHRIELSEVEHILHMHEEIKEAVVVAHSDNHQENMLCAYYVSEIPLTVHDLKLYLSTMLPEYAIPSYFVQMDYIPLTYNGKVNKRGLPNPLNNINTGIEYLGATNETEETLIEVWKQVLKVDTIGILDNFFELGGHSLKATILISMIHKVFDVEVPLAAIFKNQTLKELAVFIELSKKSRFAAIEQAEKKDSYELSAAQKRLYVLSQLDQGGVGYNIPVVMTIEGTLDSELLKSCIEGIVGRHEVFRTSFILADGEPVQRIHTDTLVDIQTFSSSEDRVESIIRDFIQPFDLTVAPLLRVGLIEVCEQKYILIFDMHHIIADGTSIGILMRDFVSAYEGSASQSLRIQYKDYSEWQNNWFRSEAFQRQEQYWMQQFLGELPLLNMPVDYPRPSVQSYAGDAVTFGLSKELTQQLNELASESGATVYMILLAAYNILLHKYTGQEDIIVGSPVAGRQHTDVQHMVGMFVNTLAIRSFPRAGQTFKQFLEDVKLTSLDALDNQDYPFEELVDRLNLSRDLSRNPLFDTVFSMLNMDAADVEIEGLTFKPYEFEYKISKFDLTLQAVEAKETGLIEFRLEYNTDLFAREKMDRLAVHLVYIIKQLVKNPDARLRDIELATVEEQQQILSVFNNTGMDYPADHTIHELFMRQVNQTPDNTALVYDNRTMSYKELNDKSNQVAAILRGKGVRTDYIVALIAEPSFEMIIGMLGILKAGGAYLPIDPDYPVERTSYMLQDSDCCLLLGNSHLVKPYENLAAVVCLDDPIIETVDVSDVGLDNAPQDLAYVIYTSGSTGNPKGVMVEHRALVNLCSWHIAYYAVTSTDRSTKYAGFGFDASVWEIFPYLISGSAIYIITKEIRLDVEQLNSFMEEHGITISFLPTPICEQFLRLDNKSLKKLLTGGDYLKYVKKKSYELFNNYGPTENTVVATSFKITEESEKIPVGKPISNCQALILDSCNNLLPIGVSGELCISGTGLARGYVCNAPLTEEKFVPHPFFQGERMYRTGDLARWLPDGNIEFLGRIDRQVKIRGHRIELGEVEAQLLRHPSVIQTAVTDKTDSNGHKVLCAYIVSNEVMTTSELRTFLSGSLPEYEIPSYFITVKEIALTSNGKVNRDVLPEPKEMMDTGTEYIEARDDVEERLKAIWHELLGVETISIKDNFFELGGHSLKATSLVSRIAKEFNVHLPIKEVFSNQTLENLAVAIKEAKRAVFHSIVPAQDKEFYPVSAAQKRIFILSQFNSEDLLYNVPGTLLIEGAVNRERVEHAVKTLVNRHEAFRTSFAVVNGEPVQKVQHEAVIEIRFLKSTEQQVEQLITSFIQPFNLSQAPLLRVGLVRLCHDRHVLVFDMHHIIADGTSMDILVREFLSLYQAQTLPPLRIHYKDYSDWQNSYLASDALRKLRAYWKQMFTDDVPVLNMPTDYPRPAVQSFEGDTIGLELRPNLVAKLSTLTMGTGTTLYMVLLAAYNVILAKYTGQEDIVVGSPIAGRPHADLENIVGMFVNTLALRNYPNNGKTFKQFLMEVKDSSLQAYENQDYPFDELVDMLSVRRDLSRNPLFDVMFAMQSVDVYSTELDGVSMKPFPVNFNVAKFDLTLNVLETNGRIRLTMEYCTKLFKRETVERLLHHYEYILDQVTENASIRLEELELLTLADRNQLLLDCRKPWAWGNGNKTICQLFEEQAARTPDHIALVFENQTMTYRELNEKANALARGLIGHGIHSEDIVAILVERSLDMMISIMGVLKSGGAYLPIDPNYPADRISYTLEDSCAKLILTHKNLHHGLAYPVDVLYVDECETYHWDTTNTHIMGKTENLAYVIYTSGTTGRPKGAMIEDRNVVQLVMENNELFHFGEKDTWTLFHSYSFDFSVWEMYGALLYGGKLVIVPKFTAQDTKEFLDLLIKEKVTVLNQTPSAFYRLMEEELKRTAAELQLRCVIFGGEALKAGLLKEWSDRYSNTKLINMYGITETTVFVTHKEITKEDISSTRNNIGRPLPTYTAYIVDSNLRLQPRGVAGELLVGGKGVGRGYLNRGELTSLKFIENPFEPGEMLYRSGDIVRLIAEGELEYLGRIDHQVKIRGYRIELGEIESRLIQHEAISEVILLPWEDSMNGDYLCAYIVSACELSVAELRAFLGAGVPDYMIPSYFIRMEELPLTSNGKVDRNKLPQPVGNMLSSGSYVAPANDSEAKLAEIWQDILDIEHVGVTDNFFELGGHSLKATIIMFRITQEFHVQVPLREFFNKQIVRELSMLIESLKTSSYRSIQPVEQKEYYPMSSAQKRLYILDQMEDIRTSYNIPAAMIIEGELDNDRFAEAIQVLIKRHEAFRTAFILVDNQPRQIIVPYEDFDIVSFDCGEHDMNKAVLSFIQPFDLTKPPLVRVGLAKLARNKHIVLFDMHHIISDGTSLGIIMSDFLASYEGGMLSELKVQYKDFAEWQNNQAHSDGFKKQEKYWLRRFSDELPVLRMPTDFIRPVKQSFEGGSISFDVSAILTERLNALAVETGATLYMVLLAVFNVLLSKYSGQEDIIVGSPIAGRSHSDLYNVVGMFVNTLAMRNYPQGERTFLQFLEEVKENSLQAYENQDYQFEELIDNLNLERDMSRNPLFDVAFVLQNTDMKGLKSASLQASLYKFENITAKFDIWLCAVENDSNLEFIMEYSSKLYKRETIERMSRRFISILQQIVTDRNSKINELEMVTNEEMQTVLHEFNNDVPAYIKESTIHRLFEEQVDRTPDRIAVVFEGKRVSYGELDRRANRYANYLNKTHGIGPDSLVGVMLEKTDELIAVTLGILKSGGAYIPIDPEAPEERIKSIIEDAGLALLISSKKNIRTLNRLQWETECLRTFLCVDSTEVHSEKEAEKNDLMREEVWRVVGLNASNDIEGGAWTNSYTGNNLSEMEMEEYSDNIYQKLKPCLRKDTRVLEIGCASGLSMYRIAPEVGLYYGTDLSQVIIERNKGRVAATGLNNIKLSCLPAHDINQIEERDFDIIIINSVVQCFHGHNYLRDIINKSIKLMKRSGILFIGDIMDQDSKDELIRSMLEFKRSYPNSNYRTKTDWSVELFLSRAFFEDLQTDIISIQEIRFSDKIHTIKNELTQYRYDVMILVDNNPAHVNRGRSKHKNQHGFNDVALYDCERIQAKAMQNNLAYVIYTSGTTGKPKGAMIEHQNVVQLLKHDNMRFNFNENDVWTLFHSYCFDFSVWEMYGALLYGGKLVVVPKAVAQDTKEFLLLIQEEKVTVLNQTPSAFYRLMNEEAKLSEAELCLRYLIFGGEALQAGMLKKWKERYPLTKLINMYGITETTVHVTYKEITDQEIESGRSNIGRPLPTVTAYVMNDALKLQPVGIPGELCVGGTGVSRGYLNRAELTYSKFIQNPYKPGERLYRSGDIVRLLPDGDLEYLGRKDQQVKIRGYRIERGEIEAYLIQHESISEAVVVDRQDSSGDIYLCAYLISDKELTVLEIREFLSKELNDYAIPSYFVRLDTIPLTANGKLNRKEFPDPVINLNTGVQYVEPASETEMELAAIWRDVLEIVSVGTNDNFFELGGHSLKAVQVISLIMERLSLQLKVTDIFANPTLKELADYVDHLRYYSGKLPIEKSMLLLNEKKDRHIFAFPPIIGYSIGFHRLARIIDTHSFYSFDYIENKGNLEIYVELIMSIQQEGPYVLLGYSAGGNLAYEVARRLEEKGQCVSDIILMDSYIEKHEEFSMTHGVVDEMVSKFLLDYSVQNSSNINIDQIVNEVLKRSEGYAQFYNSLEHEGVVHSEIHVVKSDSSIGIDLEGQWNNYTSKTVQTYQGTGPHADMIFAQYSDANGRLIKRILNEALLRSGKLEEAHGR